MTHVALIGFGEAGQAFAGAPGWRGPARVHDLKGEALAAAYAAAGVRAEPTAAAAVEGAELVLSLVTADQALTAARTAAPGLDPGALYADLNSVAPDTKRRAAEAVETAGGRYLDVAVMAPVHPGRLSTPLLVSGPHAAAGVAALRGGGFTDVSLVEGPVGAASAIKMIRSVMVKGLEALTAECALAAQAAGVLSPVLASLEASWPGADWSRRFDYNLDRMMAHGERRAAEMEEVVRTLWDIGVDPVMSLATAERQRALGRLHAAPPQGLAAKLARLASASAPSEAAA